MEENKKTSKEERLEGTEIRYTNNVKITEKIKQNGDKLEFLEIQSIS